MLSIAGFFKVLFYIGSIIGREDIFAVQWSYDGKNGYSPQRRKIQKKDITTHLKGEKTLGIYQLKVDNSIKFGAFDIDIKKGI